MTCGCEGDKHGPPPIGSDSPAIADFVLYAERSLRLGACCEVTGGDIGVHAVQQAGRAAQLTIGAGSTIDECRNIYAPSISLERNVRLGIMHTDVLTDAGLALGSPIAFPSATMPAPPLAPAAGPAGADVSVGVGQIATLVPGNYGSVTISGTLLLNPGVYSFGSLTLTDAARLVALAGEVAVRVRGTLVAGRRVRLFPAFHRAAETFSIAIGARDGGPADPAASFGEGCRIRALIAVPHGTLVIADHTHATGAFAAFDIAVGNDVRVAFQGGFSADAPGQRGTQQLQGYYGPHPDPSVAPLVGPVPAETVVPLAIGLPVRDPAGLQNFIGEVSDPKNPNFRKYLTQSQFIAAYGAPDADYKALQDWAAAAGFATVATFPNKLLLCVSGTAAQVEQALHVNLNYRLQADGVGQFVATDREPSLDLPVAVLQISGLTEFRAPQPAGGTGGGGSYRAADLRTAYLGVDPNLTILDGTGQVVGLLELNSYNQSDIVVYDKNQLPVGNPANVELYSIAAPPPFTSYSLNVETAGDIEIVQAMAPNAQILVFQTALGVTLHGDAVLQAMANATPPLTTASCSYTFAGSSTSEQALQQLAAQGVSFFTASGDFGDVGDPENNLRMTAQTLVGGTILATNALTAPLPKPAYPNPYYAGETTWNVSTPATLQQKNATGGGVMNGVNRNGQCNCWPAPYCCGGPITIPDWQVGVMNASAPANGGSVAFRNYPDVAMVAANVEVFFNGQFGVFGGTSAAAPLWAGFTALINQRIKKLNPAAGTVGFLNPTLYDLALTRGLTVDLYQACFNDIADNVSNFNGFGPGFTAVAGYDLCTGLGSPKPGLIYQLSSNTPLTPNQPLEAIRVMIGTGGDNLRGNGGFGSGCAGTGCTIDILFPGYDLNTGVGVMTRTLKATGTDEEWKNNTVAGPFDLAIDKDNANNPIPAPTPSHGIVGVRLNIQQDYQPPCGPDNWNVASLSVVLFQPPFNAANAVTQLDLVGTTTLQSGGIGLVRLSNSPGQSGVGLTSPIFFVP